jgi:hypothetical protein
MGPMHYIGLDVHNQKISYCVKDRGGKIPLQPDRDTRATVSFKPEMSTTSS